MATLYWGGGTGTWDGFTTTNWYTDLARTTLSGRAPAVDDDVIFDATSNATDYTVTISGNTTVCRSCTISGPASGNLTLAGSGTWYIYGDLTLPATGFTRTFTGTMYFYATDSRTITSNGVSFNSTIFFAGVGGTWTLQDAFSNSTGQAIRLEAGTLDTNGKNLTCGELRGSGLSSTTLTLGASTVSVTTITFLGPVTINGGTSTITLSSASASFGAGTGFTGGTFHNVTFSSNAVTTCSIYGNNTFNNLTFTTPAAARISNVVLYGNQTVNGTLTISGQSSTNRYSVVSDTPGTARTLTVATVGALTDVDFRDITVAGASSPWSGTRLGDCKGNTNITFSAGVNKYIAAGTGSSNWTGAIWATTSGGGTGSIANFPLAQDTVIIDNAGLNTSATLTLNIAYNIGGVDSSSRTNAMTFSIGSVNCYGDINVSSNLTISGNTGVWVLRGRNTQNITSNGKVWAGLTIDSPGGTVKFLDNFDCSTRAITLTSGTLDCNGKNITCGQIDAQGSATRTLTLGSGTITTSTGVSSFTSASNLTVTSNTATITCSSSANIGFNGLAATFGGAVTVNGASSICNLYGTTTIANLTIGNAPTTTGVTNKLQLFGDLTVTGTLALAGGTSVTQRASVLSNTLGTQRTLSAATVTGLTDIDFRDINATGAANWTTGTRLGDCGGNAGITFPAAKTVYWNLAGTQNWSATAWTTTASGGTPAANDFPLAQDTAVFDDNNTVGTVTMNAAWNIGTISAGGRTSAWTLAGSSAPTIYGDVTYGSGITTTNTGLYTFSGRGTQTYTTAGKTVTNTFTINKPAGTFQHGDAYTSSSSGNLTITAGTYTTQNYNISATNISSSNSNTRSIILGISTLTLSGAAPINFSNATNLTFSGASSTINLSSTSSKTFNGGGQEFGTVSSTGGTTNPLIIAGSNKFNTLTNSARTFLIFSAGDLPLATNSTTQEITNFTYSGASGSVVRWFTSVPGKRATIKSSGSTLAVGANSTDGGNNTGLSFTGSSPDYFYVKDIAYSTVAVSGSANFLMFFN